MYPAAGPEAPDYSLDGGREQRSLFDVLTLSKKHAALILGITAVFLAVAGIYCMTTTPLYTADTTIELRGYAPLLAGVQSETMYGNDTRKIEYQKTTVAKLKLDGLADEILTRAQLAEELKAYFESRRGLLDQAKAKLKQLLGIGSASRSSQTRFDQHFVHHPNVIRKYLGLIDINPVHETNLVSISVTTADPKLSPRIANAHATGFIQHLKEERQRSIEANLELLQRQSTDLKNRVADAEKALSDYAQLHHLVAVSEADANGSLVRQIDGLADLLADATSRRVRSESMLDQARAVGVRQASAFDDETTRHLLGTLRQAEAEYAFLNQRVTPAHPDMVSLKAKIALLRESLVEERRRIRKGLQNQFEADKSAEDKLREQIAAMTLNAQEVSKRLIGYNVLQKEAESLRDLYQSVLKQVKEFEISAASTASTVFISDFASIPTSASSPKIKLTLVMFGLLGLGAGLFAAILRESFDNTLENSGDVNVALDLPVLGAVPKFETGADPRQGRLRSSSLGRLPWKGASLSRAETPAMGKPFDVAADSAGDSINITMPTFAVAEALRSIRAGILLSSADRPPRVIMVTSATKGEGKTTVLSNLAVTLAQASQRVLVIDADLRASALGRRFGLEKSSKGLSDCLTGHCDVSQAVRHTSIRGLDVMPAGTKAPDPAELLGSNSMKHLVHDMLARYEFLLLDSAPVLPVADGLLLSRVVDGALFVVRSRVTERRLAQEAKRRLLRINTRILGVVLNDLDMRSATSCDLAMYGDYVQPAADTDVDAAPSAA